MNDGELQFVRELLEDGEHVEEDDPVVEKYQLIGKRKKYFLYGKFPANLLLNEKASKSLIIVVRFSSGCLTSMNGMEKRVSKEL